MYGISAANEQDVMIQKNQKDHKINSNQDVSEYSKQVVALFVKTRYNRTKCNFGRDEKMDRRNINKPEIPSSPVVKGIVNSQLAMLAGVGAYFVVFMTLLIAYTAPAGVGSGAIVGYAVLIAVAVIGVFMIRKSLRLRKLVALLKQYVDIIFTQGKTKLDDIAQAIGKDAAQVVADLEDLTERCYLAGVTCDTEKGELVLKDLPVKVVFGDKNAKEKDKVELHCTSCGLEIMVAPGQICRCPRCYSAISINMKKYNKSQHKLAQQKMA